MRSFLTELDLTVEETEAVLADAAVLKRETSQGKFRRTLENRHVALYFEKPSVRTRVSFAVGIAELGGASTELTTTNTKVGKGEDVEDFATVLGRYVSLIVARVFSQNNLERMAASSGVPVINALSDAHHPCQALADVLTIQERKGSLRGLKLGFVGEGNNVATSTGLMAASLGMEVVVASPRGFGLPDAALMQAQSMLGSLSQTDSVKDALQGADVLYTDTWISMGQESEAEQRRALFNGYRIDGNSVAFAKKDAIVMHCLPAVRDEEITHEVMRGPQSAIWDQAENRLHAQKALMCFLMGQH
jgi:ornithine carbamoyltransferase